MSIYILNFIILVYGRCSFKKKKYTFQKNDNSDTKYICNIRNLKNQYTKRLIHDREIQDIHNRFVYFKLVCPKNYNDFMYSNFHISIQFNEMNILHSCIFEISPCDWKENTNIINGIKYSEVNFPCSIPNCNHTLTIRYNPAKKKKVFNIIYKNNIPHSIRNE